MTVPVPNEPTKWDKMIKTRKNVTVEKKLSVRKAIVTLRKNKLKVNFNSVSIEAKVGIPFLHKYFYEEIDRLRKLGNSVAIDRPAKERATDASKDVKIAAQAKKIQDLIRTTNELKKENEGLLGKFLYFNTFEEKLQRLEKENDRLQEILIKHGIGYYE